MKVPTPHNNAKIGDVANTVLMPGDPLRAKFIADTYLTDVVCYNEVRNMLGFTGNYKGTRISVQGSGMGIPSMAIYSRELFEGYDVDNIIRIGSAGSLSNENASDTAKSVELGDIIVAQTVDTDSNFLVSNEIEDYPMSSIRLLEKVKSVAAKKNVNIKIGEIFTSDTFYQDKSILKDISRLDVLGVEMETLALYANAMITKKRAIAMFTVTDNIILGKSVSSNKRQEGLKEMIELALDTAYEIEK